MHTRSAASMGSRRGEKLRCWRLVTTWQAEGKLLFNSPHLYYHLVLQLGYVGPVPDLPLGPGHLVPDVGLQLGGGGEEVVIHL